MARASSHICAASCSWPRPQVHCGHMKDGGEHGGLHGLAHQRAGNLHPSDVIRKVCVGRVRRPGVGCVQCDVGVVHYRENSSVTPVDTSRESRNGHEYWLKLPLGYPGKRTCKPNSVVCGHSSRPSVTARAHQRPTRRFRQLLEPPSRIGPMRSRRLALDGNFPPYLVLLRVGFTKPPSLPPERCALTAPFHPYLGTRHSRQISSGEPYQGLPS
jgi:hypothetical protein